MTLIKDLADSELEDLIMDLRGRLELTSEQVEILIEAEEEYERRESN